MNKPICSINQVVCSVVINNQNIDILAISDDQSEMIYAYQLWYKIYIDELKLDTQKGVDHESKTLSFPENESLMFLAMKSNECIATLKATFNNFSENDFNYKEIFKNERVGELSKLLVKKSYRKSLLSAQVLIACYDFNKRTGIENKYDLITMNCMPYLYFYYRLFGFKKISNELFFHPGLDQKGRYILACTKKDNKRVIKDLKKLVKGENKIKVKWAFKYWVFRKVYS